jgi:hypothetical protein
VALTPAILDEAKTWAHAGFLPLTSLLGVRPLRPLFLALSLFVVVFALFAGLARVALELNFVLLSSLNEKCVLHVLKKLHMLRCC